LEALLLSDSNMARQASAPAQSRYVEVGGYRVPVGSSAIHFYYTKPEQQRLLGFLIEGVARHEKVFIASAENASEALSDGLEMLGVRQSEQEMTRLEITSNLRTSLSVIANSVRNTLGRDQRSCVRLLCDFGLMIGQEAISELENSLHSGLAGLDLVAVTQYDGRGFGTPITIEQFHNHALAIVGSAFFHQNRYCSSPEAYRHKRVTAGRK